MPVDRNRRDAVGELGCEDRIATDVAGLLATLHYATGDDIFDGAGIEIVAVGDSVQRCRTQIHRVNSGQTAAATTTSGANRVHNIGFCHSLVPLTG